VGAAESEARADALLAATEVVVSVVAEATVADEGAGSVGSGSVCGTGIGPIPAVASGAGVSLLASLAVESAAGAGRMLTRVVGVEKSDAKPASCAERVRANATRLQASKSACRRREKGYLESIKMGVAWLIGVGTNFRYV